MSASAKSVKSTHSSQLLSSDRNHQDDPFGADIMQGVTSPRGDRKQSQLTQGPINTKEHKENSAYKSKFPTNMWTTNDELLRLHYINKLEKSQQTDWPYKWSFLIDEYKALSDDMASKEKSKNDIQKEIDALRNIVPPETSSMPKSSQLGCVPQTSSGIIGWKTSQKNYIQSKYPEYLWEKYCTDSFEKQMKWPSDSQY